MKKLYFFAFTILAFGTLCFGQTTSSAKASGSSNSSLEVKAISLANAVAVDAQLQNTLDAKNAKVGDSVILKTTKAIKERGETVIPKGTSLIGRVTEVKQRTKDNASSKIGMVIDRIEGKNLSSPISASIVSIVNTQTSAMAGDTVNSTFAGGSQSSASTSGGSSSGGGGLLGGVGSTVGGVTNTVGGVANTATQTVGGLSNTATQTLGSTTGTVGRTINGIQISNSISGSAGTSAELSSPNRNVKVEKGATFQMQLSNRPAEPATTTN